MDSNDYAVPVADKLNRLADLLAEASRLVREIGRGEATSFKTHLPQLNRPAYVPKHEEWLWSAEWQAGEREADEALNKGDYETFASVEALIADLHRHV